MLCSIPCYIKVLLWLESKEVHFYLVCIYMHELCIMSMLQEGLKCRKIFNLLTYIFPYISFIIRQDHWLTSQVLLLLFSFNGSFFPLFFLSSKFDLRHMHLHVTTSFLKLKIIKRGFGKQILLTRLKLALLYILYF